MTLFDQLPPPPPPPDDLDTALCTLIREFGYATVSGRVRYLAPSELIGSAPARWGDPETSHAAGPRSIDVGRFSSKSRQAKLLAVMSAGEFSDQDATIRVVGAHAPPSAFEGCRRRMSDLRAAGFLMDSGRRKKNIGSDDESVIWTLTAAGHAALERLNDVGWSR